MRAHCSAEPSGSVSDEQGAVPRGQQRGGGDCRGRLRDTALEPADRDDDGRLGTRRASLRDGKPGGRCSGVGRGGRHGGRLLLLPRCGKYASDRSGVSTTVSRRWSPDSRSAALPARGRGADALRTELHGLLAWPPLLGWDPFEQDGPAGGDSRSCEQGPESLASELGVVAGQDLGLPLAAAISDPSRIDAACRLRGGLRRGDERVMPSGSGLK